MSSSEPTSGTARRMEGARYRHVIAVRVRYSETDQMGTYYNSRALEWFECGRTELLRALGLPYTEMEAQGLFLPLVEAHVEYHGRARYDDPLELHTALRWEGRARVRLDVEIHHLESRRRVASGYTVHVFTDRHGRPGRPPEWFLMKFALPPHRTPPSSQAAAGQTPSQARGNR